jgi:hypothetical protein
LLSSSITRTGNWKTKRGSALLRLTIRKSKKKKKKEKKGGLYLNPKDKAHRYSINGGNRIQIQLPS